MKYFQILLLLGINFSIILYSQSIEIDHKMMIQDATLNIPIFIYNVSNLESIQLKIEYDESIIVAEEIIENPEGILDGGYTFTTNLTEPGIIYIAIGSNSAILFSGSGMIAQIRLHSIGNLGYSALTILDAQINSDWQIPAVDGSIEIVLDELTITGQDNSEIGSDHSITLGMCEGCTDEWKFGEDEYDYPNPLSGEYTNINLYHPEWFGEIDENGNSCNQVEFASDFRRQHSFRELTSWGIKGSTGGGLSSDLDINLSWDSEKLNTNSPNFKMFLYVGNEDGVDMQDQNSITISQSDLTLNDNNEPNIWVKMGGCADTGETEIYYQDSDGDGLGSSVEGIFCQGLQPIGWVSNHTDLNDDLFCLSNNIDDCDVCDGFNGDKDCSGDCFGTATEDSCGVCNGNNDCVDCNGIAYGDSVVDCNGECDGDLIEDMCGTCNDDPSDDCVQDCNNEWGGGASNDNCQICSGGSTGLIPCEEDCNEDWGGYAFEDECDVCDSDVTNNNQCWDCNEVVYGDAYIDNCGDCVGGDFGDLPCEMDCNGDWGGTGVLDACGTCDGDITTEEDCACPDGQEMDCAGVCGGIAVEDNCDTCDSYSSNDCEMDCNGDWGGTGVLDACGTCDADPNNNDLCLDCNGIVNGLAYVDNCGNCIEDASETNYECSMDCFGEWGGNHTPLHPCQNGNLVCSPTDCHLDVKDYLLPDKFDISRIYPNPFNPLATIDFEVSEPTIVQLNIYNLKGQKVEVLKNAFTLPGHYSVIWNGTNYPSGIYFVILHSSNSIVKQKMMLIK